MLALTNEKMDSTEEQTHWYFFNCVGSMSENSTCPPKTDSHTLTLFGHTFDYSSSFLSDLNLLFKLAQQNLMLLDTGPRFHEKEIGSSIANTLSDTEYYSNIRKQICEFLFHVTNYLRTVVENIDSYAWLVENLVETVSKNLATLQLLGKKLSCVSLNIHQSHSIVHHKEHSKLEICWYHLSILLVLDSCQKKAGLIQDTQTLESQDDALKNYVGLLISDLLAVALGRFRKLLGQSEFLNKTPFRCICMKKIWALLIQLLDKGHQQDQHREGFWKCLNQQVGKITATKPDQTGNLETHNSLNCAELELFKLWILTNLARLYKQEGIPVKENYAELETIIKVYVPPDSSISEEHLRITIPLVTLLVTDLWPPKSEAVTALWEYFHRRLNTKFLLSESGSERSVPLTSSQWLSQVKHRLQQSANPVENENSFCLFLRLLGLHVKCSETKHWNQLRGRIYSKFSPTKLQTLTEEGLFNFSSLFLTLCISVNLKEVGEKFIDLLNMLTPYDNCQKQIVCRAKLMLVKLFLEEGLETNLISKPLIEELNCVASKGEPSSSVIKMFIVEMQSILDIGPDLMIMIDRWVPQYLSTCTETDSQALYTTLLSLAKKVSKECINNPSLQSSKMAETLWDHTLRCLLATTNDSFEVEAAYGMELTLLALWNPSGSVSLATIFNRFINSPTLSVKITVRYLFLFMTEPKAMSALKSRMENYQNLLIRAWLKCVILSTDENFKNLSTLTEQVAKLPDMEESAEGKIIFSGLQDPLLPFLTMISCSKPAHASRVAFYTSPVEDWLTRTPMKTRHSVKRTFKCAALFILHAPQLAYNKSSSNLVTKVVANLLLPKSLTTGTCKLGANEEAALVETIDLFVRGLAAIAQRNDDYAKRCLKEVILTYLPRLVPRATASGGNLNSFLAAADTPHPLIRVFDTLQTEVTDAARMTVELVSSGFVSCKATTPHTHAALALGFLRDVLRAGGAGPGAAGLLTALALPGVLDVVMFASAAHPAHRAALALLAELLQRADGDARQAQAIVVAGVAKRHLAFSAAYAWALFERLARLDGRLVAAALPQIRAEVRSVELRRGGGQDKGLQAGLASVERLVHAL